MTTISVSFEQREKFVEIFEHLYPDKEVTLSIQRSCYAIVDRKSGQTVSIIPWFELLFNQISIDLGREMHVLPVAFYELWFEDINRHPIDIVYEQFKKIKVYGTCAHF